VLRVCVLINLLTYLPTYTYLLTYLLSYLQNNCGWFVFKFLQPKGKKKVYDVGLAHACCIVSFAVVKNGANAARGDNSKAHQWAEVWMSSMRRGLQKPKAAAMYAYILPQMSGTASCWQKTRLLAIITTNFIVIVMAVFGSSLSYTVL